MWCTVLVLALVATADPVRIAVSAALSARPRAVGPLVAFWLGGVAISATMAVGVLFGLRDRTVAVVHRLQIATATSTAGHVQVAMGAVALLIAATAVGLASRRSRLPMTAPRPTPFARWSSRARCALLARPVAVAFALGVGMLIDFRLLAALTAIVASGAAAGIQLGAAGLYTLVALAFVELPLIGRLAAPAKTDQVMSAVTRWAAARRQQLFGVVIALLGAFLLSRGLAYR